jgi:hypothetical protein
MRHAMPLPFFDIFGVREVNAKEQFQTLNHHAQQ